MKNAVIALFLCLAVNLHANAIEYTVKQALDLMDIAERRGETNYTLLGYVLGMYEGIEMTQTQLRGSSCFPSGLTGKQIYDRIRKNGKAFPEHWGQPFNVLVYLSLTTSYPCPDAVGK